MTNEQDTRILQGLSSKNSLHGINTLSNTFDFFLNCVGFSCVLVYLAKDKNLCLETCTYPCAFRPVYINMGECAYLGMGNILSYLHVSVHLNMYMNIS